MTCGPSPAPQGDNAPSSWSTRSSPTDPRRAPRQRGPEPHALTQRQEQRQRRIMPASHRTNMARANRGTIPPDNDQCPKCISRSCDVTTPETTAPSVPQHGIPVPQPPGKAGRQQRPRAGSDQQVVAQTHHTGDHQPAVGRNQPARRPQTPPVRHGRGTHAAHAPKSGRRHSPANLGQSTETAASPPSGI